VSEDALTTEPPVPHADRRSATATPPMAAESRRVKAYAGGLSADFTLETASARVGSCRPSTSCQPLNSPQPTGPTCSTHSLR
jgi:hypothetical protein